MVSFRWLAKIFKMLSVVCIVVANSMGLGSVPSMAAGDEIDGTLSQVSVRFEATYKDLMDLADARLPLRIEGRESFVQGGLSGSVKYVVVRKGRPVVRPMGNSVAMDVPLYFTATFSGSSLGLPIGASGDGEMMATVVTRPKVLPNWRISTDPDVKISWRKPPTISVMGLRVSVQPLADRVVRNWIDQRKGRIDVILNDRLALRRRAQDLWNAISRPISIGEGDVLWLVMSPDRFWANPLEVSRLGVSMAAGLDAKMRVVGGAFPGKPSQRPLPDLVSGSGDGQFRVILPVMIHYAFVNSLIAKNWSARDVVLPDGGRARLERFGMTGRGDRFVVGAELIGSDGKGNPLNAVVNFLGRPVYDVAARTVWIQDLAVETGPGMESLSFLNDSVVPSLKEVLRFPIGEELDLLRDALSKSLGGMSYGGLKLDFKPTSLNVIDVKADTQGIRARAQAQGTLSVSIH